MPDDNRPTATPGVGDDMRAGAIEVVILHQRMDSRLCLCGWDELGHSHSAHVVDALIAAGFIAGGISALKEEK